MEGWGGGKFEVLMGKGGIGGRMEGRMDIWKFPLCFTRHWSFRATAQKRGMFSAHFFAMFNNLPDR